ncbi:MAG: CARDB domain-containing protein [Candidatus Sumerlaeaceae bacterium]
MLNRHLSRFGLIIGCGLFAGSAAAQPVAGTPDLQTTSITFKTKCKETTCTIKNVTTLIENIGTGDAANTSLDYYLSADNILTTETDTFVHRVSLGKVKAGKTKKRTLGGGLLKQHNVVSGQYLFVVIDADGTLVELDDTNNTFSSQIILAPSN